MNYKIEHSDSQFYLPKIEHWIIKDLKLKVLEAMLYKIILQKCFLTWNAKYIADVLVTSKDTILRLVSKLCELGVIEKRVKCYGGRNRWVLVALYTSAGMRPLREINDLFEDGFNKLESDIQKQYNKYYK